MDSLNNPYAITGLAFQPGTGTLYGATSSGSGTNPASLVTINPITGRVTEIGFFGGSAKFGDIKFDPTSGILYGSTTSGGNLYTINLATGAATKVGVDSGITTHGGHSLAFNSAGTAFTVPDGANLWT